MPTTTVASLLAALATWMTVTSWSGFSESPSSFLGPLLVSCLLVAAVGALLRATRAHWTLVALAQLLVLGIWFTHLWAPGSALAGWLPTPSSVRDSLDAVQASLAAAQSYAAPVPGDVAAFPPVLVLAGSLASVLVDLLACGLGRAPLAGLPLLAMYTAPVSMLQGKVSWWHFAAVAVCFLALVAVQESTRLSHWGRDLGSRRSRWTESGSAGTWPAARRIGLAATGLAVVVPLIVPTFSDGVVFAGGGPRAGGSIGVQIQNPLVNLKRDLVLGIDVPLLRFTTSAPAPAYVRTTVLDDFDGTSWKPSEREIPRSQQADGTVPAPEGLGPGVTTQSQSYDFTATADLRSTWLPAAYPVISAEVPGDWRYDLSTMDFLSAAMNQTTAGLEYSVTSLDVAPTLDQLLAAGPSPADLFRRYTVVNRSVPAWVGPLAERVTTGGESRFERAVLLQDWFRKPHVNEQADPSFVYDLTRSPGGSGVDDLTEFLRQTRTGYCEQFAAAMALMARELQIPSRVAVGFLRPDPVGENTWEFSTHDLHAWPELYFDGVGWVRFEPTPSSRAGDAPPYTAQVIPHVDPTALPSTSLPSASGSGLVQPTKRPLEDPQLTGSASSQGGRPNWLLVAALALLVLAGLGCVPRLTRTVQRRRRWSAAHTPAQLAEAAWAELRDSMLDLRLPWEDGVTVRVRGRAIVGLFARRPGPGEEEMARVIRSDPSAEAALQRIVLLLERVRYSAVMPGAGAVRADVATCVSALRLGATPEQRRRADWLPSSLLRSRTRWAASAEGADRGLAILSEPAVGR